MGSSSNDLVMTAAPAIAGFGGASGTAIGAMIPQTGFISVTEEYKALKEWANNYVDQTDRKRVLAQAQMQHLVGVVSDRKRE